MKLPEVVKKFLFAIIFLSILGLPLTAYLTYNHFKEGKSFCDINEKLSCDIVNKSIYSEFFKSIYLDSIEEMLGFDIPVSILGFLTYAGFIFLAFLAMKKTALLPFSLMVMTASLGFLYSLYLTGIEMFVLLTYCPLCLVSFAFITIILILSIASLIMAKKKGKK